MVSVLYNINTGSVFYITLYSLEWFECKQSMCPIQKLFKWGSVSVCHVDVAWVLSNNGLARDSQHEQNIHKTPSTQTPHNDNITTTV